MTDACFPDEPMPHRSDVVASALGTPTVDRIGGSTVELAPSVEFDIDKRLPSLAQG